MGAWHRGSDPHAGGGHEIATSGVGLRGAPDCPVCRFGTLISLTIEDGQYSGKMKCIDCKEVFLVETLIALGVLPRIPR